MNFIRNRCQRGFSLIEVIIVCVIIGVLAGTMIPTYFNIVEKGRGAEAKEILFKCYAGYQRAVIEESGHGPGNPWSWVSLGMSDPSLNPRRYFDYSPINNWNVLNAMQAVSRQDNSKWLQIDLNSGALTKSQPY